jgi:hypothetical protein
LGEKTPEFYFSGEPLWAFAVNGFQNYPFGKRLLNVYQTNNRIGRVDLCGVLKLKI